jgi:hypothetical protein
MLCANDLLKKKIPCPFSVLDKTLSKHGTKIGHDHNDVTPADDQSLCPVGMYRFNKILYFNQYVIDAMSFSYLLICLRCVPQCV